jgi:hypothetical protein
MRCKSALIISSPSGRTLIFSLLARRNPAAIFLTVATTIIDAVERHAGWGLSHVSKKILELKPSRVFDGNASPAIARPASVLGIDAPLDHFSPSAVKAGLVPTFRMAMLGFFRQAYAATRFDATCSNIPRSRARHFLTTVTTIACSGSIPFRENIKHGQMVKSLANHCETIPCLR